MIRKVMVASLAMLGACATVATAPAPGRAPDGMIALADVVTGFTVAVIDGCVAAAEAGQTLADLNSPLIVSDSDRGFFSPLRPGFTPWAPKIAKGIVTIEENAEMCDIATYGIPIESSFASVASKLVERGYSIQPSAPLPEKFFETLLKKTVDGRIVTVALNGNEPGAPGMRSRFGIALAKITVSPR